MAKKPTQKKPKKVVKKKVETVFDVLSKELGNKEKITKLKSLKLTDQQISILDTGLTSRRKFELLRKTL